MVYWCMYGGGGVGCIPGLDDPLGSTDVPEPRVYLSTCTHFISLATASQPHGSVVKAADRNRGRTGSIPTRD